MTIQQAKNIPLGQLLEKMGFQATRSKHSGNDVWYKSPFRPNERDASFHINVRENVWYDFGSGMGGDVVKFIEQFNNCDVSDALTFLDIMFPENRKSDKLHDGTKKRFEQPEALTLKRAQPITNPHLVTYLKEDRKIDLKTAQKHLIEVIYTHVQTGKDFYALGMANRSGGFEIRNKYFKGSIFEKDITILPAKPSAETESGKFQNSKIPKNQNEGVPTETVINPENKVSIFEGFFDFLSALKYYGNTLTEGEVIIMHSVAFQNATIAYLTARSFSRIYTYFDNDRAGEELTFAIGKHFPKALEPCSALFYPHKDFNAFWVSKKST